MNQCIDIYTGVYADNIDKKKPGAAFGAVCVGKGGNSSTSSYDPNMSYMQIWMTEIAALLSEIPVDHLSYDSLYLMIHTWTPNINKMCKKMQSIFDQLKELNEDAWDVLDIKLRRANRSRYEYHAEMKKIVRSLLLLNRRIKLTFSFKVSSPRHHPHMGIAYQKAEVALDRG